MRFFVYICSMDTENKFEQKLKMGYKEYLTLPKATIQDHRKNEIYTNGWYIMTGRSMISPHPHRHYTFLEFVYHCGNKNSLYQKFIEPLN
jgi:hypothetical protein